MFVERNYLTFDGKFLTSVSKLQPMCPAERLKFFLERTFSVFSRAFSVSERKHPAFGKKFMEGLPKVHFTCIRNFWRLFSEEKNCLSVFGLWAKLSSFWQKIYGTVAKSAFHVSTAKLWERVIKVIYIIIVFLGLWVSFFDFDKISQVCRNSNLSAQRKNVHKNSLEQLVFCPFWTLTKKTVFLLESFRQDCQTTFAVSRGTPTEQHFWKEVLKIWRFLDKFRCFRENGGKHFSGLANQQ